MTSTNRFRSLAKDAIVSIEKEQHGRDVTHEDIEVVFMSYISGNMKATFVIPRDTQNRCYEVSYTRTNNNIYIDEYVKTHQGTKVVSVESGD